MRAVNLLAERSCAPSRSPPIFPFKANEVAGPSVTAQSTSQSSKGSDREEGVLPGLVKNFILGPLRRSALWPHVYSHFFSGVVVADWTSRNTIMQCDPKRGLSIG